MKPLSPFEARATVVAAQRGIALLAVLFALTLLAVLALPFAVSMNVGADAAARDVARARGEQASASARDLLLADAALSHPSFDPTPTYDSLAEWPQQVTLPEKFAALRGEGRTLLGGGVWDEQRFLALDSVSPLVLTNLLGTTTRLSKDLPPDANKMEVEDASQLPDQGFVWLAHEVVRYGGKQDNTLVDLERALFLDQGFVKPTDPYQESTLVLDYRCVMAAAWPYLGRADGTRQTRRSYGSVTELAEIATAQIGSFTQDELDRFGAALSLHTAASTAAAWGRPERVFEGAGPTNRTLRVKSALHIGAGSTVRLRNLKTGAVEYNLVMVSGTEQRPTELRLPSLFRLELLMPTTQEFPALDTVVEPLIPAPVNVNTAPPEVLQALFAEVRQAPNVRTHESGASQRMTPLRGVTRGEARALVEEIETMRSAEEAPGQGPLRGWQDFAERLMKPRFDAAANDTAKFVWLNFYRNLLTGRDSLLEMGTAPMCFTSGPWVSYRAAASTSRSIVDPGVASRHERTGQALAAPGFQLEHAWPTQEQFEDALQLDRRSPFWVTTPINLGALQSDQGNDPASRHFPHLVPMAFSGMGFGGPRFPSQDRADAAITPAVAMAVPGRWGQEILQHDSFMQAPDPRGRDIGKEGSYQMTNVGPRGGGAPAPAASGRHDRISFPFSNQFGFVRSFATSAWLQPQSLANATLFEHGDGDEDRNRITLEGKDGNLVFTVLDEAGIDPGHSDSFAGVERTETTVEFPLADLALPADTPVHVSLSAYGSHPSELSLAVDGMPRGKAKYSTYLTGALKAFDPSLSNNSGALPPQSGNERYFDLQVESTEHFPDMGILRIGLELFEYTSKTGNSFQCQFKESIGGRGARQRGDEFLPNIPVDANGKPTVDITSLQQQGINLAVFPDHPSGSLVELYGYSTLLSEDSPMMVGTTSLAGSLGGFAVARGFIQNPRDITVQAPPLPPVTVGTGIDENWSGELELADPVPTGRTYPPAAAQANITDGFPTSGGYALLVQFAFDFTPNQGTTTGTNAMTGGIELIRYESRSGNKLTGVQRAQTLPGKDSEVGRDIYDGTAHKFVCNWRDVPWDLNNRNVLYDDVPVAILWVVPVSIAVQGTGNLWDPATTGLLEWVQLYPNGNDNDTEWVRYDAMVGQHLVRGNRGSWARVHNQLTQSNGRTSVSVGQGGQNAVSGVSMQPWGQIEETSGFIGYTPKLEADFPQIQATRRALRFRGDPFTRTSSHPQNGSVVMQCQRLQLGWGPFGSYSGRVGRLDRIAIVQGSVATGMTRPAVEWHTTNWSCRRFEADNLEQTPPPEERYGPWPFQLVAFRDGVRGQFLGPARGTVIEDSRMYDRVVKFPSGELPAAYCENVTLGSGVGNRRPMQGFVDEVDVVQHETDNLLVDEAFSSSANSILVDPHLTYTSAGIRWFAGNLPEKFPAGGGLLWIDGEIIAYQSRSEGTFTVASDGRGLLGTEARDHDRGARVHFLTHRPAAILAGGVGARDEVLSVQALAAMPRAGTVLLGRELLHYAWSRQRGDQGALEMPRFYPAGEDGDSGAARGLFRGRFGTAAGGAGSGQVAIAWPFRYWDRYVEGSDDPELAYFQLTTTEAPSFYRSVQWREETQDAGVDVVCLVRTDSKAPWTADPAGTPGLWRFTRESGDDRTSTIGSQAARLEIRFGTVYKPGVFDFVTGKVHAWKTTAKVDQVRVQYEGQGRILDERVTAR